MDFLETHLTAYYCNEQGLKNIFRALVTAADVKIFFIDAITPIEVDI